VVPKSVVQTEAELREVAREMAARYSQPALVEEYIRGREFTVGLLGERRPRVLPPMEICFTDKSDLLPVYSFQHKLDWNDLIRYEAPAKVEPAVSRRMMDLARDVFQGLGCRDVARIDFRMDEAGKIYFIECNPLPGLTPGWSDLCLIAQAAGMDYRTLVGEIMSGAIRRYKERERERREEKKAERAAERRDKAVDRAEEAARSNGHSLAPEVTATTKPS
jgi:D-alanine-D-alanine ligase